MGFVNTQHTPVTTCYPLYKIKKWQDVIKIGRKKKYDFYSFCKILYLFVFSIGCKFLYDIL